MKKILLLLLISLNIYAAYAQRVPYAPSQYAPTELLVRMKPNHSVKALLQNLQTTKGVKTDLAIKKVISEDLGIYLLDFSNKSLAINEMQNALFNSKEVFQVQKNHKITYRATTPNDQSFNQQWQYINTGQGGGTVGADLDIELAWDITTGGTTAQGDEIVVCVIDDGADSDHPDWGDNLWVNTQEIANNNIDDDGNGYTDDRLGWNAYRDNDDIEDNGSGGWHGTPVAGIVGAQGNNSVGVSGINWNVKVMVIVGGGNESDALAAYAYPHKMRQMYNQTNGQKGAFVVATNASWGIDGGNPDNATMWCDFYNDLGAVGILNAGATANANTNVDVDGDLPTACSSDYMIAVTNVNRNDNKVTQAGYGATSIDLGAFGEDTYTLTWQAGYGGFGGTSGATPHVAGTIGLLYSTNCSSFIALAKSNPGAAALAAKQYIMDGTDSNTSLQNITVSGGRLNVNGALQQLQTNCAPALAVELTDFSANQVEDKVMVDWQIEWATAGSYFNLYRSTDGNNWSFLDQTTIAEDTQKSQQFQFIDGKIPTGQLYYRLDQLELDGTVSQQHTATLMITATDDAPVVFPNPITNRQLQIKNAETVKQVEIIDLQGKVVWSQIQPSALLRQSLTLPAALHGIYLVRMQTDTGTLSQKIIIQ